MGGEKYYRCIKSLGTTGIEAEKVVNIVENIASTSPYDKYIVDGYVFISEKTLNDHFEEIPELAKFAAMVDPSVIDLDFSGALRKLREGKKVARKGWNSRNMFIFLAPNDPAAIEEGSDYYHNLYSSHIVMKTSNNDYIPWMANQIDILAGDWMIVD